MTELVIFITADVAAAAVAMVWKTIATPAYGPIADWIEVPLFTADLLGYLASLVASGNSAVSTPLLEKAPQLQSGHVEKYWFNTI